MQAELDEVWIPWEPPEYVNARGPSLYVESAHFVVRWGADGEASNRAATAAPAEDLLLPALGALPRRFP